MNGTLNLVEGGHSVKISGRVGGKREAEGRERQKFVKLIQKKVL